MLNDAFTRRLRRELKSSNERALPFYIKALKITLCNNNRFCEIDNITEIDNVTVGRHGTYYIRPTLAFVITVSSGERDIARVYISKKWAAENLTRKELAALIGHRVLTEYDGKKNVTSSPWFKY